MAKSSLKRPGSIDQDSTNESSATDPSPQGNALDDIWIPSAGEPASLPIYKALVHPIARPNFLDATY
jgi:hypothetical protein